VKRRRHATKSFSGMVVENDGGSNRLERKRGGQGSGDGSTLEVRRRRGNDEKSKEEKKGEKKKKDNKLEYSSQR